jgi:D-sedoheptulose 7-phosphate isomerase
MSADSLKLIRSAFLSGAEARKTAAEILPESIVAAAEETAKRLAAGGVAYFCGNGGSAAQSLHLAAEITGRFKLERSGLAAVALGANAAEVTAIANDYSFEQIFSRPLQGLIKSADVLLGLSGSGGSTNVIKAMEVARTAGALTIGLSSQAKDQDGAGVAKAADIAIVVPVDNIADAQEMHLTVGHLLCELIENALVD